MKPPSLTPFIPPVTGTEGRPHAVAANTFDPSGRFRDRTSSFKRRRPWPENDLDDRYDLTKAYPPLQTPPKPLFDVQAIQDLMVDASNKAETIRAKANNPNHDQETKDFAGFNIAMFDLLVAVVEKAIIPLAKSPPPAWPRNTGMEPPPVAPKPTPPGKNELEDALKLAEKTCIIFDADLGTSAVANKNRLANSFAETVRAKAIALSGKEGAAPSEAAADAAEAVRVVDDALSCANDMSFLGQVTKPYNNNRNASDSRNGTFFSMPIKLEFPDRSSRIHFERIMREKCKIRAAMSLPIGIRKEAEKCRQKLLEQYPEELVMVRAESEGLKFVAFHKKDGEMKWTKHSETFRIPYAAALPDGGDGGDEGGNMES